MKELLTRIPVIVLEAYPTRTRTAQQSLLFPNVRLCVPSLRGYVHEPIVGTPVYFTPTISQVLFFFPTAISIEELLLELPFVDDCFSTTQCVGGKHHDSSCPL